MFKNVGEKLKAIMEIVKINTPLQEIYNYDVKSVDGYPFARITPVEGGAEFHSTAEHNVSTQYSIAILDQSTIKEDGETNMREIVDYTISELSKKQNITLSGTVDRFIITGISWGWTEQAEPLRMCNITCEAQELFNF